MCATLLLSGTMLAQDATQRALYDDVQKFEQLSSAAQILLRAKFGPRPGEKVADSDGNIASSPHLGFGADGRILSPLVNNLVNNAAADATAQDTQSETTIILGSGSNVIAGFNDSGSFIGASKFTGYSTSTDGGTTWVDGGTLPTNAGGDAGDPVLARDEVSGRVYFATLQFTGNGMQMFRSDDDGATWMAPVQCAPGATGFQDKEWIAVDNFAGAGQGNVYHAYRDFGTGGGVRFTRSTDGGATFGPSPGLMIKAAVLNVQGAFVVVGVDHSVNVFWYDQNFTPRQIRMKKSTDQGATFGSEISVATLTSTGTNGDLTLPAGFRSNSFPQVTVNPANGDFYIVYNDPTLASGGDRGNIRFQQSTDGGATWSSAITLNDDGGTKAQYMPAIAVKPDGSGLAVTWYDNRNDPNNRNIERWGVTASISGSTVTFGTNFRISPQFAPSFGSDPVVNSVYMGDYDMMAADNTNFHTLWGDNRDQSIAVPTRKNSNVRHAQFTIDGPGAIPTFVSASVGASGGNGNGLIDKNECNDIFITLGNDGNQSATSKSGTLSTSTPGVSVFQAVSSYPDIAAHGTGTNTTAFQITTSPAFVCGTTISLSLSVDYTGGSEVFNFTLPSNSTAGASSQFDNTTPTPIPDVTTTNIPISVSGFTGAVGKVTISLYLTHTFDADLDMFLIAPDLTSVELSTDNGSSGDNFGTACATGTIFDDAAATPITSGTAPFVGTFRPEGLLSSFNGKSGAAVNGTWTLRIIDDAGGDFGTFQCASLQLFESVCLDGGGGCELTAAPSVDSPIAGGATSVSGTSTEADGTVIDVFVNSASVGTTTVTGGVWTKSGLVTMNNTSVSANSGPVVGLLVGDTVKATAKAFDKQLSGFSNEVIVEDITAAPVVTSPIAAGATSVSGTGPESIITKAIGGGKDLPPGTSIEVFVNSASVGTTTVNPGGSWTKSGLAALAAGDTVKAKATAAGKLTSAFSNAVIVQDVTTAPVVSSPITAGATSVSGTGPEFIALPEGKEKEKLLGGTIIEVFVNSASVGTTGVNAGGSWTKSGLAALAAGDTVKAKATAIGKLTSPFSNEVIVQAVVLPVISIDDVTQTELNGGTSVFSFTVSLSTPAGPGGVTFDITTADGTAQDDIPASEDNDYVQKSLFAQTITQGNSTYTFDVTVNGDANVEPSETFFVNVLNVVNATDGDTQGQGTITNDDAPPATNVIVNPSFESGTSPWVFYTNGTGNLAIVSPGPSSPNAARVTISTSGSNMQLYQFGITLQPNTQYRLTFKALSSIGHNLAVSIGRHDAPYTNYGLNNQLFDITPAWQTFTVDFTSTGFPPPTPTNARLRFAFNGYATPGDLYFIDDVSLEILGSPLTATKVRVETAPDGGGSVVPVQTIQNGETITMYAISRTATDQFVANVPATWGLTYIVGSSGATLVPSGDGKSAVLTAGAGYCQVIVSATSGALTPTPSNVITVFTPPPPTNLLVNGGFESGTTNWTFQTNGAGTFSAVSPGTVGAKAGQISITTQGTTVQLYQQNITLTSGNNYRLSFKAKSTTGHDIQASVFKHGAPFTPYGLTNQFFNLTNAWADYSVDFTAGGFVGTVSDARLRLWFAPYDAAGDIYQFDDVKIELLPAPPDAELAYGTQGAPKEFTLNGNFPNPFNPSTTIIYTLPVDARVTLEVFNVLGQRVAQLVDGVVTAGYHDAVFDASSLSSGLYIYRLTAVGTEGILFSKTEKMILAK